MVDGSTWSRRAPTFRIWVLTINSWFALFPKHFAILDILLVFIYDFLFFKCPFTFEDLCIFLRNFYLIPPSLEKVQELDVNVPLFIQNSLLYMAWKQWVIEDGLTFTDVSFVASFQFFVLFTISPVLQLVFLVFLPNELLESLLLLLTPWQFLSFQELQFLLDRIIVSMEFLAAILISGFLLLLYFGLISPHDISFMMVFLEPLDLVLFPLLNIVR